MECGDWHRALTIEGLTVLLKIYLREWKCELSLRESILGAFGRQRGFGISSKGQVEDGGDLAVWIRWRVSIAEIEMDLYL